MCATSCHCVHGPLPPQEQHVGFPSTSCLQLDDSKVVSGDGQAVRVWGHVTGSKYRRIATLTGHAGEAGRTGGVT